jgi:release factor glutamine methyltransferase
VTSAPIAELLIRGSAELAAAGVERPEVDARLLLAHALALPAGRLVLAPEVDQRDRRRYRELISRRAERVPLQHLTGEAHFRHVHLAVGPGVFVPRPETEVMTGWAVARLREMKAAGRTPRVVDLCSGSGAVAKSLDSEVPGCRIYAVEVSPDAAAWAVRNLAGTGVELRVEDMASALPELDVQLDLVVANPPYVPLEAYESVAPEARDFDPPEALFSGLDGLDAIRTVVSVAARLLRNGGLLTFEHAELQETSAPAVVVDSGAFDRVRDHQDLAGRPRFVTAVRHRR